MPHGAHAAVPGPGPSGTDPPSPVDRPPTDGASVVERCRALEGGGLRTFAEDEPLVWERARGAWVEDADGRRYLDLYAGYAVAAVGHQHPAVVEAVRGQAGELMHCPSAHPSRVRAEFLEALASIAPAGLGRILPAITGAMANELAVTVARMRRPEGAVVSFTGSYFGRTLGAVGLSGKPRYREALGVAPAAAFVPYPSERRLGPDATEQVMAELESVVATSPPPGPAAVMLEPIQGNGGVVVPPGDFLPRVRELCDRTGALMILDEIQSGCGRTGRLWACERVGVVPDLMTVGKGIGGGLAVSAVLGREELLRWPPDTYTSTFLTNNLNLAAGIAAIGVVREDRLPDRAADLGARAGERLRSQLEGAPGVGEVRGVGLWFGIELVDETGAPDAQRARSIQQRARAQGIIVGRGGLEDNVIKISPPLVIEEADLETGVDALVSVVREQAGEPNGRSEPQP